MDAHPAARRFFTSLRARLLLLVALALLPAFALTVWNDHRHLQDERAEAHAVAQRVAHSRALEFAEKIADVKSLLGIVATLSVVQSDPRQSACSQALAAIKLELPHISNIAVAALDGTVVCSAAASTSPPAQVGDRLWFRSALQTGNFTAGEYLVGRLTGLHSLSYARPVRNAQGTITAVAVAALDLSWLSRFVADLPLPEQAFLLVLDRDGRILARHPAHDAWVGKLHPNADQFLAAAARSPQGQIEHHLGVDGVARMVAFTRVPGSDMGVFFGLPHAPIEAQAQANFWRNLALMVANLLASFLAVWLLAEVVLLRRTQRLSEAVDRLAAGDLQARSGLSHPDEIGRIGQAFDQMAQAVAGRERELTQRVAERTAELARANVELEAANRLKSDFLASMSHELRTPLNAIIGFSEVLRDGLAGEVTPTQREYLGDVLGAGTHLLSLINDVLDLSKVEAGRMELDLEPLPVASVLQTSLSIVRAKAMAHRLTIELQVTPDVGDLCADARKLKQMVYNLLSNAVKFTPDGGSVTVAARRIAVADVPVPVAPPPGTSAFIEIAVTDNGIGIAEQDQARLFTAFGQIDSALSRQYEGTGLGLALVKRLAELHGGAVGLHSAPGAGSTFFIWLPERPVTAAAEPSADAQAAPAQPTGGYVLVVEDDAQAFELLRMTLAGAGFTVARAASAAQARACLEVEVPDLITLDILLPGGEDGWQLLAWLKHSTDWSHIPVVVVSIVAEEHQGIALGASAVLQKPYQRDELLHALAGLGFAPATVTHGPRTRVLVVDDDPAALVHAARLLEPEGCVVELAGGGQAGVAQALAAPPDLILLDLLMPDLSGFEVVARLRADLRTQATPIVIVTAKDLDPADLRALNGQVQAVVKKSSFSPDAFVTEVRRVLRKGSN